MNSGYKYDFDQFEKEFHVVFDPAKDKISQFGGVAPFIAFLKKGKILDRLTEEFGFIKARAVLQLLLGLVVGAKRMRDVANACQDVLIRSYLKSPVGEAQLGRDFRSFKKEEIERLHEWVIALPIFELAQEIPQSEDLIFDVDATAVLKYGDQEGVESGYVARDKIEGCYQYLFFRLHNLNTFLYGSIRAGSTHSQNGICEYMSRFLVFFKEQWKTKWRLDSGYFNEALFDVFDKNEATFFIKAPMSPSRAQIARQSKSLVWVNLDKNMPLVQYASILTNTEKGTVYREIFKRVRQPKKQLTLFEADEFYYDALVTNDLSILESQAYEFYNARANIENNIRELKNDYSLGKIITESFDANDVITQTTLLTYVLMSHFKRKVLPKKMQKTQLSTVRTYIFNIPGRLFSSARRTYLRLHNVLRGAEVYAQIYYRLKRLRSWVLDPPNFANI